MIKYVAKPRIYLLGVILFCSIILGAGFLKSEPASAISLPSPAIVASSANYCDSRANKGLLGFFGLKPWYHFMPDKEFGLHGDPCGIHCFNIFVQKQKNECGETASDIPGVILAVVDDLLRIAALVALAFILIGSFQYTGSRGNSERTAAAQSTIMNALVGLAIALVAVAVVSFVGSTLQ